MRALKLEHLHPSYATVYPSLFYVSWDSLSWCGEEFDRRVLQSGNLGLFENHSQVL